ncbi:acetyl-CoA hydrolase/transferase family protein [Salinispira pacifica]|uniref:4-hydroxybutyrate coenzyme A transferase n=1 Tax=Salinispira pacifica TaxID=1307761 RepID=V5WJK3_9SPIO|nr:acetyl-CoA hydrolase/transferase C-terminal domain-containing protein [Salinispira pacifica]AHC15346.1 4-hydroxybutyrate coenzyme A transferase [Salinispira pacifica]
MAEWKQAYQQKLRSMEDAVRALPKNAAIIMGMASMESQGFMSQIHKFSDHFEHLRVLSCLNMNSYDFCEDPRYEGTFMNENWFFGPSNRKAAKLGYKLVDFIPNNLHQAGTNKLAALKEEGATIVYWGPVTPMQENSGFFNLGVSNVYEAEVIDAADMVIFEVNPQVPWIHGDTQVHISQADMLVEFESEIPTIPVLEPGETEKEIAKHIADLIEDGSTLQIGIGGIPNAVASLLEHKKDLGIHTEMFTESMIDLFESGAVTNGKKTLWPGKFVFTFALGSKRMYEWLDNNPSVLELRGSYVNDPYVIAQNEKMISINTAITIDLTGQVCSESLGPVQYSGTGGQLDTHRGAQKSKGGKGFIALRSTAKKGTISTIVPMLPAGSAVTVPRQDLDWVATEFGAVHLQGRTSSERAELLISIAHPDFREELEKEAAKLGYL